MGIEVIYCLVTDGGAGGLDAGFPRAEMPARRRAEQVAAAKCVGVHDVRFLGYPDGRVEATLDLRRDLARVIRQVRPTFGRKIAALRAHESQTGHLDDLEERIRGWLTRAAALGGLPEGHLAEAFQVLDTA